MFKDYWDVTNEQVNKKTGKKIYEWIKILDAFRATEQKSNDTITYLHQEYGVLRHQAKALIRFYLKQKTNNNIILICD
jgi:hypothetical protein